MALVLIDLCSDQVYLNTMGRGHLPPVNSPPFFVTKLTALIPRGSIYSLRTRYTDDSPSISSIRYIIPER